MSHLKDIKLIVLDVDGVLTDGLIYIDSNGNEIKTFNVKDGFGINVARYYGIEFILISGRNSKAVSQRAQELGIQHVYQGIGNKMEVLNKFIESNGYYGREVCVIGDDLNDLDLVEFSGFSFAPQDAVGMVKNKVDYITKSKAGHGVVREAVDLILESQTDYNKLLENYFTSKAKVTQ